MSHEGRDLTIQILAIVVPIVMLLIMGLLSWALTQTIGRLNDNLTASISRVTDRVKSTQAELTEHKDECDKIDKAVLANDIATLKSEVSASRRFAHWVGDCLGLIGGKLDVRLPERPQ